MASYGDQLREAVQTTRDEQKLRRKAENMFKEIYFKQMLEAANNGHERIYITIQPDVLSEQGVKYLCEYAESQDIKVEQNMCGMTDNNRYLIFNWEKR